MRESKKTREGGKPSRSSVRDPEARSYLCVVKAMCHTPVIHTWTSPCQIKSAFSSCHVRCRARVHNVSAATILHNAENTNPQDLAARGLLRLLPLTPAGTQRAAVPCSSPAKIIGGFVTCLPHSRLPLPSHLFSLYPNFAPRTHPHTTILEIYS